MLGHPVRSEWDQCLALTTAPIPMYTLYSCWKPVNPSRRTNTSCFDSGFSSFWISEYICSLLTSDQHIGILQRKLGRGFVLTLAAFGPLTKSENCILDVVQYSYLEVVSYRTCDNAQSKEAYVSLRLRTHTLHREHVRKTTFGTGRICR